MTIYRKNPKKQGELGLAAAINWFVFNDYVVSVPLVDSQRYDLVVDNREKLQRVQVKTTIQVRGNRHIVSLRTMGGNRSAQTVKLLSPEDADLLFVLADSGEGFLIPIVDLGSRTMFSLGPQAVKYRVFEPLLDG